MNTLEAIAARILELCKGRGITSNGLSNISTVPQATIKSILNGESQNPGTVTIKSYVMALKSLLDSSFPPRSLMLWNRRFTEVTGTKYESAVVTASKAPVYTRCVLVGG